MGGPEQSLTTTTVAGLDPEVVDMRTLLIIGSSATRAVSRAGGPLVFTPRRHTPTEEPEQVSAEQPLEPSLGGSNL